MPTNYALPDTPVASGTHRYAVDALQHKLFSCRDFNQSLDALFEVVCDLGFTQVVYGRQVVKCQLDIDQWWPLRLNVRNFPKGWKNVWQNFERHDPYYHACFEGTLPFEWSRVQSSERLNDKERAAWKYLADFGLDRGITTPIHLPNGKFAVVSAIVDKPGADWAAIFERNYENILHLSHMFHDTITRNGFADQAEIAMPNILTSRECECMRWTALGKTSPEIAIILGRSVETVRLHMKNAMLKLNASTRAQAVAMAAQLDLLEGNQDANACRIRPPET